MPFFLAGGDTELVEVRAGSDDNFDSLLGRFNKKVQQSGVLSELRHQEYFEKPGVKRTRESLTEIYLNK